MQIYTYNTKEVVVPAKNTEMEGLTVTVRDGVKIIKFNRPHRKNSMNLQIYKRITDILNEDSIDDTIIITIFTGEGDYFSSGNDLKDIMSTHGDKNPYEVTEANRVIMILVHTLINYPKLLIAVVNGPAVGIGSTIVGLCDITYATDTATFHTPFVQLGLCCEACSSMMFPFNMGRSKASEMLLLGKKITAQEAFESNLVARVIPQHKLGELFAELQNYAKIPLKSLMINKKLILDGMKQKLHGCNNRESEALLERVSSEEFMNAIINFMSRKSKL